MVEDLAPPSVEKEPKNFDFNQEHKGHGMHFDEDEVLGNVESLIHSSPILKEKEITEEEGCQPRESVVLSDDEFIEDMGAKEEESLHQGDESPKQDCSVKTLPSSSNNLSQQELSDLKSKDPLEAFELLMSGRSSTDNKQSALTASGGGKIVDSQEELVKELQNMLFQIDVIKAIEEDEMTTFRIKTLLRKLDTPTASDSVMSFLLEFEPFLESLTKDIQKKKKIIIQKEHAKRLCHDTWLAAEASRAKLKGLQVQKDTLVSQTAEEIAEYDAAIAELQEQINVLQEKKTLAQQDVLAVGTEMTKEAEVGLELIEASSCHEAEMKKFAEEEAYINRKLERSQSILTKMKMNLKL